MGRILREAYIEDKCVKMAQALGYTTRKIKFINQNGAPDRIFFKLGHFFWCEFKTDGGIISELQKYQQQLLKDSGQEVYNCWNIEQFKEIVK